MSDKQKSCANILSSLLTIIVAIVLVGYTCFFIKGQFDANRAIVEAGQAVTAAVSSENPAQATVDYTAAITYLEAAQQAYSENSMAKITSLIYALSSTIILGYGAKMLRLGASDKETLCLELLEKAKQQFTVDSNQILKQQNDVYTAITACGNIAYLCFLLQSSVELNSAQDDDQHKSIRTDTMERLQIELNRSLQQFRDFLAVYTKGCKNNLPLSKNHVEMIKQSWGQTDRAVIGYITPRSEDNHKISYLGKNFGEIEQLAVDNLVQEIRHFIVDLK